MKKMLEKTMQLTEARIALKRAGQSISTQDLLHLKSGHLQAVNAIYTPWNFLALRDAIAKRGEDSIICNSSVLEKKIYLKRPDLGRILSDESREKLSAIHSNYDIVCIVSDGLSTLAIDEHFLLLWSHVSAMLTALSLRVAPLIVLPFARVAISDEVGFYLRSKTAIIFIGERPGSTAVNSLGIYLTYGPRPGNTDANRSCISNIRPPHGLSYEEATENLRLLLNNLTHSRALKGG